MTWQAPKLSPISLVYLSLEQLKDFNLSQHQDTFHPLIFQLFLIQIELLEHVFGIRLQSVDAYIAAVHEGIGALVQHHVLKRQSVDAPECLIGIVDCDVLEREVLHLAEELWTVDDAVFHVHIVRIPDGRTRSGGEIAVAYVRALDVPQRIFAFEVAVAAHDVATLLDARFTKSDANVVELHVVDFEERTLSAENLVSYLFHNSKAPSPRPSPAGRGVICTDW